MLAKSSLNEMPCCVSECSNLSPEWTTAFPRDERLMESWRAVIKAATGQCPSAEKILANGALICNVHFEMQQDSGGSIKPWRWPSLFVRDNVQLRVHCCLLCCRYDATENMFSVEGSSGQGHSLRNIIDKYCGLLQLEKESGGMDFLCERCIVQINMAHAFLENIKQKQAKREQNENMIESCTVTVCMKTDQTNLQDNSTFQTDEHTKSSLTDSDQPQQEAIDWPKQRQQKHDVLAFRQKKLDENVTTCNICQASFKQSREILTHFATVHPKMKLRYYPCQKCEEIFFVESSKFYHLHTHTDKYKCKQCGKQCGSKFNLSRHQKTHKKTKVEFKDRSIFRSDEQTAVQKDSSSENVVLPQNDEENPLIWRRGRATICTICNASFDHSKDIVTHFKELHPEQRLKHYPCIHCDEVRFTAKSKLYHSNFHTDKYKCKHCERRCGTKYELLSHEKTHNKDVVSIPSANLLGKHRCLTCDVTFERVSSLRRHEQTKYHKKKISSEDHLAYRRGGSGGNAAVCNLCGAEFCPSKEIVIHFEEQHPEKKLTYYSCKECEEVFFLSTSMYSHSKIHTDNYKCDICGKRHSSIAALKRHQEVHLPHKNKTLPKKIKLKKKRALLVKRVGGPKKTTKCNICHVSFKHAKDVVNHFKMVHPETELLSYPCRFCEEVFFLRSTLFGHLNVHKGKYKCNQCGKAHRTKTLLTMHIQVHYTQTPTRKVVVQRSSLICNVCQASFQHSKEMEPHFKEVHPEFTLKLYHCKYCEKVFTVHRSYLYHENLHKDIYKCKQCGKRHGGLRNLQEHEKTHHPKQVLTATRQGGSSRNKSKCSVCRASFEDSKELDTHFKENHPKKMLKTLQCRICEEIFFNSISLKRHLMMHKNKLKCDNCGRRFGLRAFLIKHIEAKECQVHNNTVKAGPIANLTDGKGQNLTTCFKCQATFQQSKEILSHFKEVHPESTWKFYPCSKCDEVFFVSAAYNQHYNIHTEKYKCDHCDKRHASRGDLEMHRQSTHGALHVLECIDDTIETAENTIVKEESRLADSEPLQVVHAHFKYSTDIIDKADQELLLETFSTELGTNTTVEKNINELPNDTKYLHDIVDTAAQAIEQERFIDEYSGHAIAKKEPR